MRRAHPCAGAVLLSVYVLANPTTSVGAERVSSPKEWTLSFQGFGPVRVGMTVAEAEKASKMKLREDETATSEPEGCHYASNEDALPGVGFMVEGRKVVRIDINSGVYRSVGGVQIGMTEQDVKKRHPNIRTEEHHYDPAGHYLSLASKDQRYGIVFETDGKVVTNYRSGERESVAAVEGCL